MAPREQQSNENAANNNDEAQEDDDDDKEMSLEELLYSTASFHAIVKPGTCCRYRQAEANATPNGLEPL